MTQNNQEEVDLLFFIKKINKFFRKLVVLFFRALRFIRRNWIVILILIALGIGYGYYVQSKTAPSKTTKILLRINFDTVNYVYSTIENLNKSLGESAYEGTNKNELLKVKSLEITPIINLRDILDKYEMNDRRLETLYRSIEYEFDDEDEFSQLPETFRSEYKYHYLKVVLSDGATEKTVDALLDYINSNEILKQIKVASIKGLEDRIASNKETIQQINTVLEKYKTDEISPANSSAQLYVVDNFDISEIFTSKVELQKELEDLQRDYVYAKDVVVNVNRPKLYDNLSFFSNKMLFYPLLFVFIFFLLALIKTIYYALKEIANE